MTNGQESPPDSLDDVGIGILLKYVWYSKNELFRTEVYIDYEVHSLYAHTRRSSEYSGFQTRSSNRPARCRWAKALPGTHWMDNQQPHMPTGSDTVYDTSFSARTRDDSKLSVHSEDMPNNHGEKLQ